MQEFKKDPKTGACIRSGPSSIKLLNRRIKENRARIDTLEQELKELKEMLSSLKKATIEPQVLARMLNEKVNKEVRLDG